MTDETIVTEGASTEGTQETDTSSQAEQENQQKPEDLMYPSEEENNSEGDDSNKDQTSSEDPEGDKVAEEDGDKQDDSEKDSDKDDGEGEQGDVELKLPKDAFLQEEALKEVEAFAKENNLSHEQAQKLVDQQNKAIIDYLAKEKLAIDSELDNWRDEVVKDGELGGANLQQTKANAQRVMQEFGSEELKTILRDSGYGDNPHVVRFMAAIGKAMGDDKIHSAGDRAAPLTPEQIFYGNN